MDAEDYFWRTPVITIATSNSDGREVAGPLWGVAIDGTPYIRSAGRDASKWYARAARPTRNVPRRPASTTRRTWNTSTMSASSPK
jgi:hypothetical protein